MSTSESLTGVFLSSKYTHHIPMVSVFTKHMSLFVYTTKITQSAFSLVRNLDNYTLQFNQYTLIFLKQYLI